MTHVHSPCQCTMHNAPAAPKPEFTCDAHQQFSTHQGLVSQLGEALECIPVDRERVALHLIVSQCPAYHVSDWTSSKWVAPWSAFLWIGLECVCILGPHIVCMCVCVAREGVSLCAVFRALLDLAVGPFLILMQSSNGTALQQPCVIARIQHFPPFLPKTPWLRSKTQCMKKSSFPPRTPWSR